jgi:phospholipase/lecithinase/hemolysin
MLVSGLSTNAFADQHFSSVIAFGDSLSDNGNYYRLVDRLTPLVPQDGSPPLPYFFGRFSNGPIAVELLAEQLGLPLDDHAVGNISASIGLLYARGARHFLLPNLPDLGLTPVAHQLPRAHIYAVDVAKIEQAKVSNPAASGLSHITDACISDPRYECILSSFNARPTTYLYWDDVHPTAEGHALLAAHFLSAVSSEEP